MLGSFSWEVAIFFVENHEYKYPVSLVHLCNNIFRGLLLQIGVFGDVAGGYQVPVGKAFDDFTAWRKSMKIQCSQKRFSAKSLVRELTYGWYLNAKGYNARVVSEWLMCKFSEVNAMPEFSGVDHRLELCETALKLGGLVEGFVITAFLLLRFYVSYPGEPGRKFHEEKNTTRIECAQSPPFSSCSLHLFFGAQKKKNRTNNPPKTKFVTQPAQERSQSFLRVGGACLQTLVLQLKFIHPIADGGRLWRVVGWMKFYPNMVLTY